MKILDVQEYRKVQYEDFRKRRTSQFIKFLDKNVDFVTYYSINKAESTYSLENRDVDSYIGLDSPIRYNKINNLPVYGFPIITDENTYEDTDGGLSNDGYEGEIILLPDIMEPCEGDAFILNSFNPNRIFIVNSVTQTILKSKPHFVIRFHIGIPEYLDQLNKQVIGEYNAIFDNIGTQDKVIISNNEYSLRESYKEIYSEFSQYYKNAFFKSKISLFELSLDNIEENNCQYRHFIDKFLQKFMQDNRIIIMDDLLKDTLMLDYNNIFDSNDYFVYKKSIFWAIINKDISNIPENCNFIYMDKINSPFALTTATNSQQYFTSEDFFEKGTQYSFGVDFDFNQIVKRYLSRDTSIDSDNPYTRVLSIIVNYMYNNTIMPGYFSNIIGELTPIQEYELIPVLMYIIKEQINNLIRMSKIL